MSSAILSEASCGLLADAGYGRRIVGIAQNARHPRGDLEGFSVVIAPIDDVENGHFRAINVFHQLKRLLESMTRGFGLIVGNQDLLIHENLP